MEINADNVINDLLDQNKASNYQITILRVASQQLEQRIAQLEQENKALKDHIKTFDNATHKDVNDSED